MTAIDIFTKQDFEDALPVNKNTNEPLWVEIPPTGTEPEFQYLIMIDDKVGIQVRSSVRVKTGISASKGADSIRAWLVKIVSDGHMFSLGNKATRWTTRLPGWQDRLVDVIRTLWKWRKKAGDCLNCDEPKSIFKSKKENENKGRFYATCIECKTGFLWITERK